MNRPWPALALLFATAVPALAPAQTPGHAMKPPAASAAATTDMTEGEVRKVDKAAGKLTIRHGEIKNLDMPPMTMVFVVKDKAWLDKLQPGDKIRFAVIDDAGRYTVTAIEVQR